jgi:hypothetical protein
VDVVESLAIERAKRLFGAEHANAQPHAGAQASAAVLSAFAEPGDAILGLDLARRRRIVRAMADLRHVFHAGHELPAGVRRDRPALRQMRAKPLTCIRPPVQAVRFGHVRRFRDQGRIEDLMHELKSQYTIVIVTHNMQQATRVSHRTAFFSVLINPDSDTRTGVLVEYGPTQQIFENPHDRRTEAYVTGRIG